MNRRIKLIFAFIGIIIAYSAFWYFLSIQGRDAIAKQLKINKEEIISAGYPLRLRYKLPDDGEVAKKNRISRVSLDIFTKHISVELRDIDLQGGLGGNIESISRLKIRGKLESYYAAYKINESGKHNLINLFNLFERVGVNFKLTEDKTSGAYLSGDVNLSIPSKRMYKNQKDLYSDLPTKTNLEVNYRLFSNAENNKNIPEFYKKIYKMVHPENVHISLGLNILKKGIGLFDLIKNPLPTIKNFELTGNARSDNPMVFSKTDFTVLPDKKTHRIMVKNVSQYKGDSIKVFLEGLLKDDYADLVIYSINRMGLVIPDNIKNKIRIFTDAMYARLQTKVISNPEYWGNLHDFKGKFDVEIAINQDDPLEDILFKINLQETSLESNLTLKERDKRAKGVFVINDRDSEFSELVVFGKFAMQTFEDEVTEAIFSKEIAKHDSQINKLHEALMDFSDNPEDRSGKVKYTFDLNAKDPFQSMVSKKKNLGDLLHALQEPEKPESEKDEDSEDESSEEKAPSPDTIPALPDAHNTPAIPGEAIEAPSAEEKPKAKKSAAEKSLETASKQDEAVGE